MGVGSIGPVEGSKGCFEQRTEGDERVSEPLVLGIRMFQVEETGSSKALSLNHVWEKTKNKNKNKVTFQEQQGGQYG